MSVDIKELANRFSQQGYKSQAEELEALAKKWEGAIPAKLKHLETATQTSYTRLSPKLGRRERIPEIPLEGSEIPLGTTVRLRRQMLGLSLKEVAEKIGDYPGSPGSYTDVYIGFLELGKRRLSDKMLERFAYILGNTEEELKEVNREQLLEWRNAIPKYTKQR